MSRNVRTQIARQFSNITMPSLGPCLGKNGGKFNRILVKSFTDGPLYRIEEESQVSRQHDWCKHFEPVVKTYPRFLIVDNTSECCRSLTTLYNLYHMHTVESTPKVDCVGSLPYLVTRIYSHETLVTSQRAV